MTSSTPTPPTRDPDSVRTGATFVLAIVALVLLALIAGWVPAAAAIGGAAIGAGLAGGAS